MTSIGNQWKVHHQQSLSPSTCCHCRSLSTTYQTLADTLWSCMLWASKDLAHFPLKLMLCCGRSQMQTVLSDMLITASVGIGSWSKRLEIKGKHKKQPWKSFRLLFYCDIQKQFHLVLTLKLYLDNLPGWGKMHANASCKCTTKCIVIT